jgi:hypothetical protein
MVSKITLTAFVILLIISHPSMANPIVQTQPFSGTTGFSANLPFDKFNASGTLTSVEIILNLHITGGSLTINNTSSDPANGTFEFGTNAVLSSTDIPLLGGPGITQALNHLSVNLKGNDNDVYSGGIVPPDIQSGFVSNLTQYKGSGSYNIMVKTYLWTNYDGSGEIEYSAAPLPTASGYIEVIYTYDPIPEPATICLLGLGALSLIRRKNNIVACATSFG